MVRYVAFLRGVNVGGRTIRMERLRQIFAAAGFANVQTFIASGNVIFESRRQKTPELERRIEISLEGALGYPVAAFIRQPVDLEAIVAHDPFPNEKGGRPATIHVGFLRGPVSAAAREKLMTFRTDVDDFDVEGQELYWLIRGRFSDSKLAGPVIERTLGLTTMRNRNTVVRLAAKLRLA